MKKNMIFALCALCMFSACQQGNVDNNEIVELTPEFILAVQKYDALGEFSIQELTGTNEMPVAYIY